MTPAQSSSVPLAVVIPAYRARFLGEAVESFARQTNRNFNLYIGDDASGEDLASVVKAAAGGTPFTFRRFENNLGRNDLVGHWERCIALTQGEPWI